MNERIRQLADEALQLVADERTDGDKSRLNTDSYHVKDLIQSKFAELIVEECCNRLSEETIIHDGYGYNQHELYNRLRKHFGVK
jgi:hypothetical protein